MSIKHVKYEALIITYNRLKYLTQCIESLNKQSVRVMINVWDNGSADGTKKWIKQNISKLNGGDFFDNGRNVGTADARNIGLSRLQSDIVLLTDDDMWYPRDFMEAAYGVFEVKDDAGVVTAYNPHTEARYKKKFLKMRTHEADIYMIDLIQSCPPGCWVCDRELILSCGGFFLPKGKLMGYSSRFLVRSIYGEGKKFYGIYKYKGKPMKVEHMDTLSNKRSHLLYYKDIGYVDFRLRQKYGSKYKSRKK